MSYELKNSRIWIVYRYLCTDNPYEKNSDKTTYYAFTTQKKAQSFISKERSKFQQICKQCNLEVKELINDKDEYFGYTESPKVFCCELRIEGSIPVIFDFNEDWNTLNNNGKHALPDRTLFQNTIHIVKEIYECEIGGCPDLPDSAYIKLEDAILRAKTVCDDNYNECMQYSSNKDIIQKNYNDTEYTYSVTDHQRYLLYYIKRDVEIIK